MPVIDQFSYTDVPEPWRILDLTLTSDIIPAEIITILKTNAHSHYLEQQINGDTWAQFFYRMVDAWNINKDTLERMYEQYDTDIAKPIQGRKMTTTTTRHSEGIQNATNVPLPDGGGPSDNKQSSDQSNDDTETVNQEMSDLGVTPNYEMYNGFINNNQTLQYVFNRIFKKCFTMIGAI